MDSPSPSPSPTPRTPRRQVAYYPHMNSTGRQLKPFSRSAAKRESVMALGSIEHLQHYFTKAGIAADKNPLNKPHNGMVPAIGAAFQARSPSQGDKDGGGLLLLPPTPIATHPDVPLISPYVKTYETDPENLRPGVIEDLDAVERAWWLSEDAATTNGNAPADGETSHDADRVDILDLLRTTTHAVRSIRNYLLSLPDDTISPVQPHFRPNTLSSSPIPKRQVSLPDSPNDPLSRIRRSALEVLGMLRIVEEASRLPLTDDAYDAQSEKGEQASVAGTSTSGSGASVSGSGSGASVLSQSRPTSPEFLDADSEAPVAISYLHVGGRREVVPVWEDEDAEEMNMMTEEDKKDRWDERLVLGGGWLYMQDVSRSDLDDQREVVARYVDAVDEVLFGGRMCGKRGWVRERERERELAERQKRSVSRRRVSAGSAEGSNGAQAKRAGRRVVSANMLDAMRSLVVTEEPEDMAQASDEDTYVDDVDLPEWAKRSSFSDDAIGRLYALLRSTLSSSLQALLPPTPDKSQLLQVLSSGQLLCNAYNTAIRRSRKPWGYISRDSIHDIAALEAQFALDGSKDSDQKRGWTFRRTDNLRLWAAALKLRYELPVFSPTPVPQALLTPGDAQTPLSSPKPQAQRFPTTDPPIVFDAPLVARKEKGWEKMLEELALKWVECVVDEKRGKDMS